MDWRLISTGFDLPGYRNVESLGLVRGVAYRVRTVVEDIGSLVEAIRGKSSPTIEGIEDQSREEAIRIAIQKAEARGANALLGVRYDTFSINENNAEVVCYATAMRVEREDGSAIPRCPRSRRQGRCRALRVRLPPCNVCFSTMFGAFEVSTRFPSRR